jgi:mannose-6-phosphate isomerase
MTESLPVLLLEPQYRDYVWGGNRLRPGQKTAEIWAVYEENLILSGPLKGQTLGQAASRLGASLLGSLLVERTGHRFPLLIKLLDCAQWLSLQVHPNDRQAVELEGPGQFGKTEAWHVLEAQPGAEILCGFQPGADAEAVRQSVRDGVILDYTRRVPLQTGDTVFIKAGTLHALGPGLLVYEVQQTSNITYRVFDWNRPASAGRPLHLKQSLAVLDLNAAGQPLPRPPFQDGAVHRLVACDYFTLDLLDTGQRPHHFAPGGLSFHALTVSEGSATLAGDGWELLLERFDTALVPASIPHYEVRARGRACLLKAAVEKME